MAEGTDPVVRNERTSELLSLSGLFIATGTASLAAALSQVLPLAITLSSTASMSAALALYVSS